MLGLETALALALTELVEPGARTRRGPGRSCRGARPRSPASATSTAGPSPRASPPTSCVFDPAEEWTVDPAKLASRARNTPYAGRTLRGKVRHTLLCGEPIVLDGEAQR